MGPLVLVFLYALYPTERLFVALNISCGSLYQLH